jgi:hypothetical protein
MTVGLASPGWMAPEVTTASPPKTTAARAAGRFSSPPERLTISVVANTAEAPAQTPGATTRAQRRGREKGEKDRDAIKCRVDGLLPSDDLPPPPPRHGCTPLSTTSVDQIKATLASLWCSGGWVGSRHRPCSKVLTRLRSAHTCDE